MTSESLWRSEELKKDKVWKALMKRRSEEKTESGKQRVSEEMVEYAKKKFGS